MIYILFILYIILNASIDWYLIEKKKIYLNHKIEGLKQLAVIVAFSVWNAYSIWVFVANLFLFLSVFLLQFDYVLNFIRKKEWWHLGDALFDKILYGYNNRYKRLALKVILVLIAVGLRIFTV